MLEELIRQEREQLFLNLAKKNLCNKVNVRKNIKHLVFLYQFRFV